MSHCLSFLFYDIYHLYLLGILFLCDVCPTFIFVAAQKGEAVDINMTVVAEEQVEDNEETADTEVVEDNEHYKQDQELIEQKLNYSRSNAKNEDSVVVVEEDSHGYVIEGQDIGQFEIHDVRSSHDIRDAHGVRDVHAIIFAHVHAAHDPLANPDAYFFNMDLQKEVNYFMYFVNCYYIFGIHSNCFANYFD